MLRPSKVFTYNNPRVLVRKGLAKYLPITIHVSWSVKGQIFTYNNPRVLVREGLNIYL